MSIYHIFLYYEYFIFRMMEYLANLAYKTVTYKGENRLIHVWHVIFIYTCVYNMVCYEILPIFKIHRSFIYSKTILDIKALEAFCFTTKMTNLRKYHPYPTNPYTFLQILKRFIQALLTRHPKPKRYFF